MLSLRELLGVLTGAELLRGKEETRFEAVSTDSRRISVGDLFIALPGERYDGHRFVAAAKSSGAAALLVSEPVDVDLPTLMVKDTRIAFGELARLWRRRFPIPLIAVVGSNGKTTTKEMIASILRQAFGEDGYLATTGNLNNDVGVPTTLLGLKTRHGAAVIEIGMNHPGETAWLASVVEPSIVVVTNAQREHQEFMQSVAAVAEEHALAIKALGADGVAVIPAADPHASVWRQAAAERRLLDYCAIAAKSGEIESSHRSKAAMTAVAYVAPFDTVAHFNFEDIAITAHLVTAGLHNVHNAAAAATAAFAASIDPLAIAAGLERFAPVKGRMQRRTHFKGGLLIDDTYNANPDSVLAAIAVLAESPGPQLLILGDMGEVGAGGVAFHEEIGAAAARLEIELLGIGPLAEHAVGKVGGACHFVAMPDLLAAARTWLGRQPAQASILVKGSRFMQMERIADALSTDPINEAGSH
jgi:UDP-N-acetylmuramoyl-tripeptide--D-alanyl-D-alanine ligase